MLIVIVGAGAVGYNIARQLISENNDVVLIEKDIERAKYVSSRLDCLVINDSGNSVEVLKKAGIKNAEFFISVTDSDEVNMISCGIVSSEFHVHKKIARIRNLEYIGTEITSKKFLGIDFIVNPEVEAANVIIETIKHGAISDIISFEHSDVLLRNLLITNDSIFKRKSIKIIRNTIDQDFLIVGINRNNEIIIPHGETIIEENDKIYIMANKTNIDKIFHKSGINKNELNKIILVGGGKIGNYLLKYLNSTGNKIVVIEKNYNLCKKLSEKYPDLLVINVDITDETIFEEEQLNNFDLIINVTDNQELNILTAIYAKQIGIKRSISLVVNNNYLSFSTNLGIDSAVSPNSSSVDSILKFIRHGNIASVHSIFNGRAEVLEFTINNDSIISGKAIKNIRLPGSSLILGITRDDKYYIPNGNFIITDKDRILIIALKNFIHKIENMLNIKL